MGCVQSQIQNDSTDNLHVADSTAKSQELRSSRKYTELYSRILKESRFNNIEFCARLTKAIHSYCYEAGRAFELNIPLEIMDLIHSYWHKWDWSKAIVITYNNYKNATFKYDYVNHILQRVPPPKEPQHQKLAPPRIEQKCDETGNVRDWIRIEKIKYKMLLLGAAGTGKSTMLKQFRYLCGRQFDQSELLAAKPHLTQNH